MSNGQVRLHYPEYGTVETVVWLVPVASAAGPVTAALAERAPSLPVGPLAALALWALLAVLLYTAARRHAASNPRTFDDRGNRTAFVREGTPGQRRMLVTATLLLVGGVLAVGIWPIFLDAVERIARALVTLPALPGASFWGEVLEVVVFALTYGAFARGLDWALIGLLRMAIHRNATMRGRP